MAYSLQTFVAGEQPTTAKWNLLWSNDASFNDGTGIGTGAIGTTALAASAVTSAKMNIVSTTDANGWTKYAFGTYNIWQKRLTFTQSIPNGSGTTMSLSSNNIPTGLSDLSSTNWWYDYSISSGNAYQVLMVAEMATSATAFNFTATRFVGATASATGFINVLVMA